MSKCLSFCPFSCDLGIVCPAIYGFWLPLWYLRTFLHTNMKAIALLNVLNEIHTRSTMSRYLNIWYQFIDILSLQYACIVLVETRVCSFGKHDWLIFGVERHFQQYFSYIMATSFSGGRSRSTRREPPTMGKQLVNFITCGCESSAPFL
jgi:hypothetical protein